MAARPPPPVSQQMEQIDQQIVALLQDIDEAFSNLHQTVATRLIPAVKRFNHNAEPTREFAKFWRQFFELAANTRVPDAFSYNEHPSQSSSHAAAHDGADDADMTARGGGQGATGAAEDDDEEHTVRFGSGDELTRGESSFMAGLAGLGSSTPLVARNHARQQQQHGEADETARTDDDFLIESPVDRLGRMLRADLALGAGAGGAHAHGPEQAASPSFEQSLPSGAHVPHGHAGSASMAVLGAADGGGGRSGREPWEDDDDVDSPDASFAEAYSLDEYAAYQDQRAAAAASGGGSTPRAAQAVTSAAAAASTSRLPTAATAKPYASSALPSRVPKLPPAASLSALPARAAFVQPSTATPKKAYTGLTNLAKTPLSTSKATGQRTFGYATSRASSADSDSDDDDDDSFAGGANDFLPPGMSPPVTMNFTLPPARGAGRFVVDDRPGADGGRAVVDGAVRSVETAWSGVSAAPADGLRQVDEDDDDDDDDEDDDSFEQTFHGASQPSAATLPPGSITSQHSYLSSAAGGPAPSFAGTGGSGAAHDQSFDSDSDSSSSSDDDNGGAGDSVDGPPAPAGYAGPPNSSLGGHSSLAPSYAASPAYAPHHSSPAPSSSSYANDSYASHGGGAGSAHGAHDHHQHQSAYAHHHHQPPPDVSSISFNPNLTANDSLFAPLPPIPYPQGYVPPSPAGQSEMDDDDDSLASMDDPFHHGALAPPRAGQGRPGFGLYGTEGEMYTFNGGRLEDAAPTESPTPFVPEPKRY